jgi:hypothetical protein
VARCLQRLGRIGRGEERCPRGRFFGHYQDLEGTPGQLKIRFLPRPAAALLPIGCSETSQTILDGDWLGWGSRARRFHGLPSPGGGVQGPRPAVPTSCDSARPLLGWDLSSSPWLMLHRNELKVLSSYTHPAHPVRGRGHAHPLPAPFLPCASLHPHHPYRPRCAKTSESLYLDDPAGRRHLAAHHDPREGAASGAQESSSAIGGGL